MSQTGGASGGSRPSESRASVQRRQAIASATTQLLRERDAAKITIADVAELAGVSVATVYNLVGTRERVLADVIDRYVGRLADELGRRPVPRDPADAVVDVIRLATEHTLADPIPMRSVLRELGLIGFGDHPHLGLGELVAPHLEQLRSDRPDTPSPDADLVIYGFRGVLMSWGHGLITDEQLAIDSIRMTRHLLA